MRIFFSFLVAALLVSVTMQAQTPVELKTRRDSVSYAIGMNIGQNFKLQSIDVDIAILSAAMESIVKSTQTVLTEEQAGQVVIAYQQEMMAKQEAEKKLAGAKNKAIGDDFLAKNKSAEGVKTTESGLQYKVLVEGTGPKPAATDKVKTHYRGTLIDGTEFDSSYKRGEPAVFPVTGVIKGWTEALQLMTVGSKWMLYIPSNLAYGENGAGQTIGPNTTLLFEIELLGIEK